jgi:hypothetical protein
MAPTMTTARRESQVDAGTLLAGLGALLLLISLFLDWYGEPGGGDDGLSAWNAFEVIDIVLAGLALAVAYGTVSALAGRGWPRLGAPARIAGPLALVLVAVSIVNEPPVLAFVDPDLEVGIWLALAGALLMTLGVLLERVRVSFVVSPREPAAGPGPPAPPHDPEAETRPLR